MTKSETLKGESVKKSASRIQKHAVQKDMGFMECGEIIITVDEKLKGKGSKDNFKAAYDAIRDEFDQTDETNLIRAVRTLDNAKHAAFVYEQMVLTGEMSRDAFYDLSFGKCVDIRKAMGGQSRGAKVKNPLSAGTVAELVKTVEPNKLTDELEMMSTHGVTVEEYFDKKKTDGDNGDGDGEPAKKPDPKRAPKVKTQTDPTKTYLSEIEDLRGQIEAVPPEDVEAVADALEGLLIVLRPETGKVIPIKQPTKKQVAARSAKSKPAKKTVKAK